LLGRLHDGALHVKRAVAGAPDYGQFSQEIEALRR